MFVHSAVGGERDRIQVATSPNLESGSWTSHGQIGLPIAFPVYSRIDANLVLDPPNNPFIAFGSYAWGLFGIRMTSSSGTVPYPAHDFLQLSASRKFIYLRSTPSGGVWPATAYDRIQSDSFRSWSDWLQPHWGNDWCINSNEHSSHDDVKGHFHVYRWRVLLLLLRSR